MTENNTFESFQQLHSMILIQDLKEYNMHNKENGVCSKNIFIEIEKYIFYTLHRLRVLPVLKNLTDIISLKLECIKRTTENCRINDYFHLQGCFILPFI